MSADEQVAALTQSIRSTGQGRLHGKIAIVTGGSSSIGRAICLAYAREGAKHVANADRRSTSRNEAESAITTHDLINQAGGHASFHECDVTDSSAVEAVVQDVVQQHGRLDVMVNNAGIAPNPSHGTACPIWESRDAAFDLAMKVNCNGVYYGTRSAAKVMVDQEPGPSGDRGWIVNLASIYGLVAAPHTAAYNASKHACMGITKSAAMDCAPQRIHVNAICPGYVDTAMTERVWKQPPDWVEQLVQKHPFKGIGETADIAPIAVFLASEDARWVTGIGLPVDGGFTCQ